MNKFKMRVNKRLTDELARIKSFSSDFYKGEQEGINFALYAIDSIDEPEKPVLNKNEAEWVEALKETFPNRENRLYIIARYGWRHQLSFNYHGEPFTLLSTDCKHEDQDINRRRLVDAIIYGYEVEGERLYTAKLKISDEYLCYDKDYKEIHHFKVPDDVTSQVEAYHFTKDDLIKYHAWENEAYDVKEVEGE